MSLILKKIIAVMPFFASILGMSQSFHGFADDNFNGVYGLVTNPANVVDSRHRLNINVASFNGLFASDFDTPKIGGAEPLGANTGLFRSAFNSWLFNREVMAVEDSGFANETLANIDVLAPLSFMASINEKHAVGLLLRGRAIYNYNNFDGRFWKGLTNSFLGTDNFNFRNQDLDITTHYWSEIGLTYGTVIADNGTHFLKAGGTFKLLLGLGAEQIFVNEEEGQAALEGNFNVGNAPENSTVDLNGDFTYVRTFSLNTNMQNFGIFERLGDATSGIGGDVGFVYEYRTRASSRVSVGRNGGGFNKYKFKLAVSLLDIGKIAYSREKVEVAQEVFINQTTNFNANQLSSDFIGTIENEAQNNPNINVQDRTAELEIALPTSLQISADLMLKDKTYYLNGSFNSTLVQSAQLFNNNRINLYSLTARYEQKHYSFYVPLSYSKLSEFQVGLGARLGPVTLGTASLINLFTSTERMNSIYLGANIPLLEDRDQNFRRQGKYHKKRRQNHRRSRKRRR